MIGLIALFLWQRCTSHVHRAWQRRPGHLTGNKERGERPEAHSHLNSSTPSQGRLEEDLQSQHVGGRGRRIALKTVTRPCLKVQTNEGKTHPAILKVPRSSSAGYSRDKTFKREAFGDSSESQQSHCVQVLTSLHSPTASPVSLPQLPKSWLMCTDTQMLFPRIRDNVRCQKFNSGEIQT